jgi:hypothetical protein
MPTACPKCHLPWADSAWQCDGCGYEVTQDFESVRSSLRAQLRTSRIVFWLMVLLDLAIVGAVVYMVTRGMFYISAPLVLGAIAGTGAAAHKISVLREHLRALDRRHVPLPKATVRSPS